MTKVVLILRAGAPLTGHAVSALWSLCRRSGGPESARKENQMELSRSVK